MKKKEWNDGLNHLDTDLVEKHIEQREKFRQKNKNPKGIWLRFGAIAACFCLIVGVVISTGILNFSDDISDDPPVDGQKKEVLSINALLGRTDFGSIIYGDTANVNPDNANININSYVPSDDVANVEWNEIKLTKRLYDDISKLNTDTVIAIVAKSLSTEGASLNDYVYNGKTYAQMLNDLREAENIYYKLVMTKNFADDYLTYYNNLDKDDHEVDLFWEKVYVNIDKNFLYENNYVIEGENLFNNETISADLKKYEDLRSQLENDINLCRIEYRVHNAPNIDWEKVAEKGFDVYQNEGIYIVVLSINSMDSFVECIKDVCADEVVANTVFRYATHAELGLPITDIPSDDGQDAVTNNANNDPIEIPHYEQPVVDDAVVE